MLYQAELLRLIPGDGVWHLNPTPLRDEIIRCIDALNHVRRVMDEEDYSNPRQNHMKLNIVFSGWLCILLGSLLMFTSGASTLVLSLAAPVAVLGLVLLIIGLLYKDEEKIDPKIIAEWEPDHSKMPDSGRVMYRVDTTLIEPIRTSILCGKCANLFWEEGTKPKSFTCPKCLVLLWHEEEE